MKSFQISHQKKKKNIAVIDSNGLGIMVPNAKGVIIASRCIEFHEFIAGWNLFS